MEVVTAVFLTLCIPRYTKGDEDEGLAQSHLEISIVLNRGPGRREVIIFSIKKLEYYQTFAGLQDIILYSLVL